MSISKKRQNHRGMDVNWDDWPEEKDLNKPSRVVSADDLPFSGVPPKGMAPEVPVEPVVGPVAPKPPVESCIFPYLMPLAVPTVVRIAPNLLRDLRVLPMILACTAASAGVLELFGPGVGRPVTVLMGPTKHAAEDSYALSQIQDNVMEQHTQRGVSTTPVLLLHHCPGRPQLSDAEGRRELQDGLSAGSVLIIYDLAGWGGGAATSSDARSEIMDWLVRLADQGHPTVIFEPYELSGDSLADLVDPDDVIEIDRDSGAPYDDAGGGCILRRQRRGIFDEFPLRWNFWYRVQEGLLSWGMEVRDDIDDDALTEHERKVLLRQIRVAKGIKGGADQKKLADALKVSASTICRDVKELRNEGRIP